MEEEKRLRIAIVLRSFEADTNMRTYPIHVDKVWTNEGHWYMKVKSNDEILEGHIRCSNGAVGTVISKEEGDMYMIQMGDSDPVKGPAEGMAPFEEWDRLKKRVTAYGTQWATPLDVVRWMTRNKYAMKRAIKITDAKRFCRSLSLIPRVNRNLWRNIKQNDRDFQKKALQLLTEFDSPYNVLTSKCYAFKCGPKLYPGDFKMPFSSAVDMLNHAKRECQDERYIFRENNPQKRKTLAEDEECPRHFYGTSRKIVYFKHKKQLRSITMTQWSRLMNARLNTKKKR